MNSQGVASSVPNWPQRMKALAFGAALSALVIGSGWLSTASAAEAVFSRAVNSDWWTSFGGTNHAIEILKEVSVDGATFFDANDSASAPATAVGEGALYRLTVTNTGTSALKDVLINDAALGILDFPVGNLAPGEVVVLTEAEIPELEQPGRCQDPGDVTNIATADGETIYVGYWVTTGYYGHTGHFVTDSDPAVVRCVEDAIEILKEVSVDGGATFFDANDSASAPATTVGEGAVYRLAVANTGTSALKDVLINDAALGILDFPVGDLAAGETVVLTTAEIPALEQPGRCQDPGDVTNIATADGETVFTHNTVADSDPAVVQCILPTGGQGCTPGYWKQPHHLDSWPAPLTPSTQFSAVFEDAFPGLTLRQVLRLRGGKLKALGRHTVAALLNAASPDVSYDLTPSAVVSAFNAVFPGGDFETQKDIFQEFNRQGCPLN